MIQTNGGKINNSKQTFKHYNPKPLWQTTIYKETTNKRILHQLQWQAKEES
jgi:hypothetical protein